MPPSRARVTAAPRISRCPRCTPSKTPRATTAGPASGGEDSSPWTIRMKNPHRFHGPARQLTHAQQRTTALVNSDQDRRRFRSIGGRRLAVDELPGAGGIEIDHAPTRQPGLPGHYPGPQRGRRDLRDVRRRDGRVSSKCSDPDALDPLDDTPPAERLADAGADPTDV